MTSPDASRFAKKPKNSSATIEAHDHWCFANLCAAAAPASHKMIATLEGGRTLSVEVVNTNLTSLATTVPIDQFAVTYYGAPAEIFEQVIDER